MSTKILLVVPYLFLFCCFNQFSIHNIKSTGKVGVYNIIFDLYRLHDLIFDCIVYGKLFCLLLLFVSDGCGYWVMQGIQEGEENLSYI